MWSRRHYTSGEWMLAFMFLGNSGFGQYMLSGMRPPERPFFINRNEPNPWTLSMPLVRPSNTFGICPAIGQKGTAPALLRG